MTREEYLKLKPGNLLFGGHDLVFGLITQPFDGEVCIMIAPNSRTVFDDDDHTWAPLFPDQAEDFTRIA
jgi:hypothetical protein